MVRRDALRRVRRYGGWGRCVLRGVGIWFGRRLSVRLMNAILPVVGVQYDVNAMPDAVGGLVGVFGGICPIYLGYCCVGRVVCLFNGGDVMLVR